jgi:hypothetical protein
MNLNHLTLQALLLAIIIEITLTAAAIQKPTNIDARKIICYNNTPSMPNQQFNYTFQNSFTTVPIFVYGINDYRLGDQFAY